MLIRPPFFTDDAPPCETPLEVAPGVKRLVAGNAGPFTYTGTSSYIIEGSAARAIVDPGPVDTAHISRLAALVPSHILVTHTHKDHSPAANPLKAATDAPTYGFGPHGSGIDGGMAREDGHQGVDWDFHPDHRLADGDRIDLGGRIVTAIHTPGHCSNHLCFWLEDEGILLTGDHVMSFTSSIVIPPEGEMAAYMAALDKVRALKPRLLLPAHGRPVDDPQPLLDHLARHRLDRETQVIACLTAGLSSISDIVARLYSDLPENLHRAAALSVHAHLIKLVHEDRAVADPTASADAHYRLSR